MVSRGTGGAADDEVVSTTARCFIFLAFFSVKPVMGKQRARIDRSATFRRLKA